MVLAQDAAQASEAQHILDVQQYRKDKAQYDIDKAQYDKEKAEYDKKKAEYDAEQAKIQAELDKIAAEEERKRKEAEEKARKIAAERAAIEEEYKKRVEANPYKGVDPWRTNKGRTVHDPSGDYLRNAEQARKSAHAAITIRESGIELVSVGALSRTASKVLQGKAKGGDRHVQYQVGIVYANQAVTRGEISPSEYLSRVASVQAEYQKANQQFTLQKAKSAATTAQSNRIKDQTARAIASGSGAAIGTTSGGTINVSVGSNVSQIPLTPKQHWSQKLDEVKKVSASVPIPVIPNQPNKPQKRPNQAYLSAVAKQGGITQAQANLIANAPIQPTAPSKPATQTQRGGKVLVTTPDGKERIFQSNESADKFISRYESAQAQKAPQQYQVTTPDGKVRTFNTKERAQKFADRVKSNYQTISPQQPDKNNLFNYLEANQEPTKFSTDPGTHEFLAGLDAYTRQLERGQKMYEEKIGEGVTTFVTAGATAIMGTVTSTANLLTGAAGFINEKITGTPAPVTKQLYVPKSVVTEGVGGTMEGVINLDTPEDPSSIIKPEKFDIGKGYEAASKQAAGQPLSSTSAQLAVETVPLILTGGLGTIKQALGVGSRSIILPVTAKVSSKAPIIVPVAKEYTLFGKPIVTKTYVAPTGFELKPTMWQKITKAKIGTAEEVAKDTTGKLKQGKEVLVDKSTTTKLGGVSPTQVLERSNFYPVGAAKTGFETMTGSKYQTSFNREIIKATSPNDVKHIDEVSEGVKLSNTTPGKIFPSFEDGNIIGRLTPAQNTVVKDAIKILQSPRNWFKGQRRVGQVGGSVSQNAQLKPKYQKGDIHDYDIDVPTDAMAVRGAKTVFDKVKPLETDDIKFILEEGGTKVKTVGKTEIKKGQEVAAKGESPDEFIEFLGPRDVLKGDTQAINTGLRFGKKYRTDSVSSIFKRPIKDPNTNIKIRDIKDQTLAKASSVLTAQGPGSKIFKSAKEAGAWELKQDELTKAGVIRIAPPVNRGKDTVDLYRIFKSQSEKLKESKLPYRQKRGERLDEIAENLRARSPELDYNKNLKSTTEIIESPSSISLLSSSISSKAVPATGFTPTVRVIPNQQASSLDKVDDTRTSASASVSPKVAPRDASKFARQLETSKAFESPSASTASISPSKPFVSSPSAISKSSTSISKGNSIRTSSRSLLSSTKSVRTFSKQSPRTSSPKSPSVKPLSPTVVSPSTLSPKTPSPRVPAPKALKGPASRLPPLIRRDDRSIVTKEKKKKGIVKPFDIKNTQVFNKEKQQKHVDFLGNTKTDHIEGLFTRKTILRGDRKTDIQVKRDKKRGFSKMKVRVF